MLSEVPAGKKPDAILYEPLTRHIFVGNNGGNSMTVLDGASGRLVATIELGGAPETSVSDLGGFVYTNLEDTNEMVKIDARTLKVTARWKLSPCETPTGLAIDRENMRLFAGCRSHHFAVVDAGNGKVLHTATIGDRVDAAAFDPKSKRIFLSNGDGTINVFHQDAADKYSSVETITTAFGGKTMALDSQTGLIYVSAADFEPANPAQKTRSVKPGSFHVMVIGSGSAAAKH